MSMQQAIPDLPYEIQNVQFDGEHVVIAYVDPKNQKRRYRKFDTTVFDPTDCDEGVRTRVAELLIDICALIDEVERDA